MNRQERIDAYKRYRKVAIKRYSNCKEKCPTCGNIVYIWYTKERKICGQCGNYVYPKRKEFKDKLLAEFRKNEMFELEEEDE